MNNPFDDTSKWTFVVSRFDTPQFLIDGMRQLIRQAYGDEFANAMEATIPPPYGTLGI